MNKTLPKYSYVILILAAFSSCDFELTNVDPTIGKLQSVERSSQESLQMMPPSCGVPFSSEITHGGALNAADVIEIEPGKLMAVLCNNRNTVAWYFTSQDGGATWLETTNGVYNQFRDSNGNAIAIKSNATCFNLFKEGNTILAVMNIIDPSQPEGGTPEIMRSNDNGVSWTQPVQMLNQSEEIVIQNARNIVRARSGRIIVPIQYSQYPSAGSMYIGTLFSDDNGITWQKGPKITGENGDEALSEPSIAMLDNGQLIMLIRTQKRSIYKSYSDNNGDTWSDAFPIDLKSPWTSSTVKITSKGYLLAIYTYSESPYGPNNCTFCFPRKNITASASYDGGLSWCNSVTIASINVNGPINEELVQPSLLLFDNKALVTYVYTDNGPTQTVNSKTYCVNDLVPNYGTIGPGQWAPTTAMTSYNEKLYVVESNSLYEVDSKFGTYSLKGSPGIWPSTHAITAIDGRLCILAANRLYRVDQANGNYTNVTGPIWTNPHAMTSIGNSIFIFDSNRLYRVDPFTGNYTYVAGTPAGPWTNPQGMTSLNGWIYIVSNDRLYRVHPIDGSMTILGGITWQGTKSITSMNGNLYIDKAGKHYVVDPSTGANSVIDASLTWPNSKLMTPLSQKNRLYFFDANKINFHEVN